MRSNRIGSAISQVNLAMMLLLSLSLGVDLAYNEARTEDLFIFGVPMTIAAVLQVLFIYIGTGPRALSRENRYRTAIVEFIYLALLGSIPFMASGLSDPASALFESTAGFTTTGLSTLSPEDLLREGHGMLFYRCAIQWLGGLFYLVLAFLLLSEISEMARRSAERKIFSWIGLVPNLPNLTRNLTVIYSGLTLISFAVFSLGGLHTFDSICLSMGTVSTGGYSSAGRSIPGGFGMNMLAVIFMFLSGMGFYVHLSLFKAKGRRTSIFDSENLSYMIMVLMFPFIAYLMLISAGFKVWGSLWKGAFATISAMTSTGFQIEGMGTWPDSLRFLLVLLVLMGGSSLSLASGFKVQRVILLLKGFLNILKGTNHPRALLTVRRGEGIYSDRALETANMSFLFLIGTLGIAVLFTLLFTGAIFDVISLCAAAVSNSGIAFGPFSGPDGISTLNWSVKLLLSLTMVLGRFEILLPLYLLSPKSYTFTG